jgi:aminoglycoside phosphotransferase (APT) family kinase protein
VIDEIRDLLSRRLPGYEVGSVARLGEGLDNAAYEVNGELIVRASKERAPDRRGASTRREADLLAAVHEFSPLPVPEPVFADPEAGVLAYFKLPGIPLMQHPVADPAKLAPALGGFVGRLHRAPMGKVEALVGWDFDPPTAWLEDAERDYGEIKGHLPAVGRRLVSDFLGRTPPAAPHAAAFCHNDLGAEHVLVDVEGSAVTGIIDWTDAAIADPARDLALIYRDLGVEVFELTLTHYDGGRFDEADRERAVFYARCKLLEDVAYGLSSPGAFRYAGTSLAHLARTFA